MIINLYSPNFRKPNFVRQALLDIKGQIGPDVIISDFNNPLIDRLSRSTINKEISELNYPIDQMGLKGIYRIFHPTTVE
jgi:hypothetical protein